MGFTFVEAIFLEWLWVFPLSLSKGGLFDFVVGELFVYEIIMNYE
jgi:hypothetical protein